MLKRIITALIFLPAFVYIIFMKNPIPYFVIVICALMTGAYELFKLLEKKEHKPYTVLGMLFILLIIFISVFFSSLLYFAWSAFLFETFLLPFILIFLFIAQIADRQTESSFQNIAVTLFCVIYIGILGHYLILSRVSGSESIFYLFLVVWVYDASAYFTGVSIGKHKLCPGISPLKTVEGLIGGIVLTAAVVVVLKKSVGWIFPAEIKTYTELVFLTLVISLAAQAGDLAESLIKRYAGVKDSSNLIPGHGGVLDKLDSFLFAAPVLTIYLYFK